MKARILILLIISFTFISCNSLSGPEKSLKKFVKYRFSERVKTKENILEWLESPLKAQVEALTEDEFKRYISSQDLKFINMRIVNKNCQDKSLCYITYTLKFEKHNASGKELTTELKKIAELKLSGKSWLISDVNNIKTFYDAHQSIPK